MYTFLPFFEERIAEMCSRVYICESKNFLNSDNKFFELKTKASGDPRVLGVIPSVSIWQIDKGIPSVLLEVFSFYVLLT